MIRLRAATGDDLEMLRRWDEAPHIVASKGTEEWGWERELARRPAWREQLIAESDDVPIGFGFRFVEQRRFGDDDCAVYRLDRGSRERR